MAFFVVVPLACDMQQMFHFLIMKHYAVRAFLYCLCTQFYCFPVVGSLWHQFKSSSTLAFWFAFFSSTSHSGWITKAMNINNEGCCGRCSSSLLK